MNELVNWVFTYNGIRAQWRGTTRDHYADLFNDIDSDNVISSSSMETLMDLIILTKGDISRMENLIEKYEPR